MRPPLGDTRQRPRGAHVHSEACLFFYFKFPRNGLFGSGWCLLAGNVWVLSCLPQRVPTPSQITNLI